MSKGSKRRPMKVSSKKYSSNWDKIFSGRVSNSEQDLKVLNWDDDFETTCGALFHPENPLCNGIKPKEIGGRKKGLDPTRYNDWEKDGRCIDF
jgi:hypothetical protein